MRAPEPDVEFPNVKDGELAARGDRRQGDPWRWRTLASPSRLAGSVRMAAAAACADDRPSTQCCGGAGQLFPSSLVWRSRRGAGLARVVLLAV